MTVRPTVDDLEEMARREPDVAHEAALRWLELARTHDDPVLVQRLLLVQADVEGRRGRTEASARIMRDVHAWATERHDSFLLARGHRLLSSSFLRVGDAALALEHAVSSVELLDRGERPALRADHLLGLATALGACGSYEEARRRFDEAGGLAQSAGDVELRLTVLNNRAYTEYSARRIEEAVEYAVRLQAVATTHRKLLAYEELDTIASVYVLAGRLEDAEQVLLPVDDDDYGAREADFDGIVTCLLTLAEVQRRLGRTAAAQRTLDRCRQLCQERQLSGLGVGALREQAELHAAEGRYREAYQVFREFHDASDVLESAEREARARTLHAIFETTEARRDSELFRELAERDPLTGLRNRRFVDARLTALLVHVVELGTPLTVALVDLDNFKAVNDTWSHDVGDEVLCGVARLLERAVADVSGGVAARMGGEEFLLILPGVDEVGAEPLLEAARLLVDDSGWDHLADALTVTVSIGSTVSPRDGTDRSALLRQADRNLYVAKRKGRNRVASLPAAS